MMVFSAPISKWSELETKIEKLFPQSEKGNAFEYFSFYYFKYFSDLYQIREIYCPVVDAHPFPQHVVEKLHLEDTDHGVDGAFINDDGHYVAWQAKFRSGRQNLTFQELATFWAEAEYADYRLIISNSSCLPNVAHKKQGHLSVLVDRFDALDEAFFLALYKAINSDKKKIERIRKQPRDYQSEILEDLLTGFSESKKGKLIAACGIGKTLISLWVAEKLGAKKVIFFAPSLQLVRQTLQEWSIESSRQFKYLCVCSDQTVDADIDSNNIDFADLDIPVTTDPLAVRDFLSKHSDSETCYIFSTYQSAAVIGEAVASIDSFHFDLALYDEAHRTTGFGNDNKFSIALRADIIPVELKLFLTATERLVRPKLSQDMDKAGIMAFSMDNKEIYGEVFHRLTFGEAIKKKIISDYRIVFTGITSKQLHDVIQKNFYVKTDVGGIETVQNLYKTILLKKAVSDLGISKVITFHSKISEAKSFVFSLEIDPSLNHANTFIAHINGAMNAQERANIIRNFEEAYIGIISNVRCLTEGIDIPLIDAVFFADPKGSMIDIVQAVGRAVRQKYGESGKIAYVIIPVLLDEGTGITLSGQGFEALFNLIQAMRDQDYALAEWIDSINLGAVKGCISKASDQIGKIVIQLPIDFDEEEFQDSLLLKIAEVNKNPVGTIGVGSKLKKNERKGDFTRIFKTLCDYTPSKLEESLIRPTFDLIKDLDQTYLGKELRINNNNISHCKRVGLIEEIEKFTFKLTPLGIAYHNGTLPFRDILKNQFLLYREGLPSGNLYPYREAFIFMKALKKINYIQFLYGLYSVQIIDGNADIDTAIEAAKKIAIDYPSILLTNESNKPQILEELNARHQTGFSFNNVWTDRTTSGNQYRYLMRHLEIYDEIFVNDGPYFLIKPGSEVMLDTLLEKSRAALSGVYGREVWVR